MLAILPDQLQWFSIYLDNITLEFTLAVVLPVLFSSSFAPSPIQTNT